MCIAILHALLGHKTLLFIPPRRPHSGGWIWYQVEWPKHGIYLTFQISDTHKEQSLYWPLCSGHKTLGFGIKCDTMSYANCIVTVLLKLELTKSKVSPDPLDFGHKTWFRSMNVILGTVIKGKGGVNASLMSFGGTGSHKYVVVRLIEISITWISHFWNSFRWYQFFDIYLKWND